MAKSHRGSCACGSVGVVVRGEPVAMGYCHCESCRRWSASPVSAFALWNPLAVDVVRGKHHLAIYSGSTRCDRIFCGRCGGHLMTNHPVTGLVDVPPAIVATRPFQPALHIHYAKATLRLADGLPKMRDLPAEMGGSGVLMRD